MEKINIYGVVNSTSPQNKLIISSHKLLLGEIVQGVDKMTRYLDGIDFSFAKGTPKHQLIMREFKKWLSCRFILKHCFPSKPMPIRNGYYAIQCNNSK